MTTWTFDYAMPPILMSGYVVHLRHHFFLLYFHCGGVYSTFGLSTLSASTMTDGQFGHLHTLVVHRNGPAITRRGL